MTTSTTPTTVGAARLMVNGKIKRMYARSLRAGATVEFVADALDYMAAPEVVGQVVQAEVTGRRYFASVVIEVTDPRWGGLDGYTFDVYAHRVVVVAQPAEDDCPHWG